MTSPEMPPVRSMLCPACGYDLRGAAGDRCSECGLAIDRAALERSSVPWVYRRDLGWARAFWRTVWLFTLDRQALRHEAAKPLSRSDAVVFRRWLTALVAVCLAGLAAAMTLMDAIKELVVQKRSGFAAITAGQLSGFEQDLQVPWSAGIALPGALFGYAVLAAVVLTVAPTAVFRTIGMAPERAEAARAIGHYAAAPLAWLAPAMAAFIVTLKVGPDANGMVDSPRLFLAGTITWFLLAVLAIGGTIYRTGQWRARVMHAGYSTGFLAMGELLLRWLLGLCIVLFVVPWCVGFLWIVIDSFRR